MLQLLQSSSVIIMLTVSVLSVCKMSAGEPVHNNVLFVYIFQQSLLNYGNIVEWMRYPCVSNVLYVA